MMNRLAVKAKINISSDGSSTASVRMHPENLGFMTLNLKISEGKAEGRILVENQTAMKLIRDEIETLKTELRNQGISLESFTVRVRDSASSQFSGFSESRQDSAAFSGFGESGQPDGERRNPEMASGRERNSNVSDGSADRITDQFPEPAISAVKEFRGFEISL